MNLRYIPALAIIFFSILGATWLGLSPAPEHAHDEHEHGADHAHGHGSEHDDLLGDDAHHEVYISEEMFHANGLQTEIAGGALIEETIDLTGRVQIDPNRLAHVRARFPGIIRKIHRDIGDSVKNGALLATVQSNESLQNYKVTAPISGVIVLRDAQPGETTSDAVLFTVVDLSTVWIELDVFDKDLERVKVGQAVFVESMSGSDADGKINWLSPLAVHASQTVLARVAVSNPNNQFRPGQFVRGRVTVTTSEVPLAVRKSAIQRADDHSVVYVKTQDTYEPHKLTLGRSNQEWIEVLDGLEAGMEYVTNNSYLIKADLEKSGASHDH